MKTPKASLTVFCFVLILAGCSTARSTLTGQARRPPASLATRCLRGNDGPGKNAIVDFVKTTTDQNNPNSVPLEDRIATLDQDGTTWVLHPIYSQVLFAFDRVAALAPEHPGWKTKHPFKAVLTGDKEAMDKFTLKNAEAIVLATHTGMTSEAFQSIVRDWMATARHPRFDKHYSEMVCQPMLEVMRYLRNNGYKGLHCDRRWAGPRTRLLTAGVRHPAATDHWLGAGNLLRIQKRPGNSDEGAEGAARQ